MKEWTVNRMLFIAKFLYLRIIGNMMVAVMLMYCYLWNISQPNGVLSSWQDMPIWSTQRNKLNKMFEQTDWQQIFIVRLISVTTEENLAIVQCFIQSSTESKPKHPMSMVYLEQAYQGCRKSCMLIQYKPTLHQGLHKDNPDWCTEFNKWYSIHVTKPFWWPGKMKPCLS